MAPTPHVIAPVQARDEKSAPALTMLSAYGEREAPSQFRWWHGAILGLFVLLIVGGLGIGGWYWWSHRRSVTQTKSPAESNPSQPPGNSSTSQSPTSRSITTVDQKSATRSADDELKQVRALRTSAQTSDKSAVLGAIGDAERKYPTDYRFTYEHAKLFGKGMISHDEAFDALYLGAEKAIDSDKAQEMLDDMTANKDGDFYRLSRGHRDWGVIIQALSSKDKTALKGHVH